MNPLQQLFSLAVEKIYTYKQKSQREIGELHKTLDVLYTDTKNLYPNAETVLEEYCKLSEQYMKKREKHCSSEVKKLLFDPFLTKIYNEQNGIQTLYQFYKRK